MLAIERNPWAVNLSLYLPPTSSFIALLAVCELIDLFGFVPLWKTKRL
ncbi:hypothetical protein HPS_0938 [Glaesserella parasuis 29755]|nr:hypothetical protein HPS_0938 [Glaesserella parasuis 29755]